MKYILVSLVTLFLCVSFENSNKRIPAKEGIYDYDFTKHTFNIRGKKVNEIHEPFFGTDFDSLVIPIKQSGNLIMLETYIDGMNGNLIFDSGSSSELVLNKTYFRNYKKQGSKTVSGVTGGHQSIDMIQVDSLLFAGQNLKDKRADLIDLSRIENRIKNKVLGFFGLNMIDDYEFVLDLKKGQLKLFSLDKRGRRIGGEVSEDYDCTQKIEIIHNIIFIWAKIAGKELRFCFDTAAERNMISHTVPKKVIQTISITGRAKLTGAGSAQSEVLIGEMNDFELEGRKFDNMQTLIADISSLNAIYNTHISGVLGYDFIRHGEITVNLKKNILNVNYY
jgi:hypothetical protein